MEGVFCPEHKMMVDHLSEATRIRDIIIENDTKIKNYDTWVPRIAEKVDKLPDMLSETYLRIVLTIGGLNLGALVIGAIVMYILRPH